MKVRSRQPEMILPRLLQVGASVVLCLFAMLPVCHLVLVSVTPDNEAVSGGLWPSTFAFENYSRLWSTVPLGSGLANSIVVALTAAVVSTLLAVGTAYCLVRFTFLGRPVILKSLVGLQALPGTMLLLPLFVIFSTVQSYLGLQVVGTRTGLIVTYMTFALPFATWVMVTHLRKIPVALEEAARIDRASRLAALWYVIMPLALPGMVVATIFSFLLGWNDVLFASILTKPETRTVAIHLQVFAQAQEGGSIPLYGELMAASAICAAPVVAMYMIFQRQLVGAFAAGGVKA